MTNLKWMADDQTAHICVDPEIDFCDGGKLAVPGGAEIIPVVNELLTHFKTNVVSQDYHPAGHLSFASAHPGKKPFDKIEVFYGTQVLWPDHCVAGEKGSELHPDLQITTQTLRIRKGEQREIDSYSAFRENDKKSHPRFENGETLADTLGSKGIKRVVLTGLAFDYCVGYTALDAAAEGFDVIVVKDATRSLDPKTEASMIERFKDAEAKDPKITIRIVNADQLPQALGVSAPAKKLDAPAPI